MYYGALSLPITVLLRLTIQRTVSRSFQRSIRAAKEAAKENERDRAPLFYTPGPMSEGAAGKSKKKKEGRPKNVLGAPLFPPFQTYQFHTQLLSSFNQLPPSYPQTLRLSASICSFLSPFYHRLLSESLSESAGTADLSVFICSFPPAFASFFSELSHQQRQQRQLGVTSSLQLDTGTKNLTQRW